MQHAGVAAQSYTPQTVISTHSTTIHPQSQGHYTNNPSPQPASDDQPRDQEEGCLGCNVCEDCGCNDCGQDCGCNDCGCNDCGCNDCGCNDCGCNDCGCNNCGCQEDCKCCGECNWCSSWNCCKAQRPRLASRHCTGVWWYLCVGLLVINVLISAMIIGSTEWVYTRPTVPLYKVHNGLWQECWFDECDTLSFKGCGDDISAGYSATAAMVIIGMAGCVLQFYFVWRCWFKAEVYRCYGVFVALLTACCYLVAFFIFYGVNQQDTSCGVWCDETCTFGGSLWFCLGLGINTIIISLFLYTSQSAAVTRQQVPQEAVVEEMHLMGEGAMGGGSVTNTQPPPPGIPQANTMAGGVVESHNYALPPPMGNNAINHTEPPTGPIFNALQTVATGNGVKLPELDPSRRLTMDTITEQPQQYMMPLQPSQEVQRGLQSVNEQEGYRRDVIQDTESSTRQFLEESVNDMIAQVQATMVMPRTPPLLQPTSGGNQLTTNHNTAARHPMELSSEDEPTIKDTSVEYGDSKKHKRRKHSKPDANETSSPSESVKNRPALGIAIGIVEDQTTGSSIVVASDIYGGGPADMAGMVLNDIIAKWNGKAVDSKKSFRSCLKHTSIGDTVKLTVIRNGRELDIPVVVGGSQM